MSLFHDAFRVFETAQQGTDAAAFGILVDDAGALRVVDAEGWRADALEAHYGARAVFQVTRREDSVRVVARSAGRSCTLEAERPGRSVLRGLDDLGSAGRLLDFAGQTLF